ncbi:M23 family metallopeptidase [Microbacterium sp.]|uniref:M23 family metallopeptidase n=1 Tax=Microbacterium sp. TaxID=51671 RepID=UPI002810B28B|nr:M23 family metallopeptidase [Microbacterium sp.]
MSENASLPERPEEKTSTSLVRVDSAAPARPVNVRRAIRRAERDARRAGAAKVRPLRAIGTVAAVGALIAGVAFPAYAAIQSEGEVVSMHDVAAGAAQSLVVASEVDAPKVAGSSYAATTPEEVEKAKAEKAAAERAKKQAEAAAAAAAAAAKAAANSASTYGSVASVPSVPAPAASGSVTFPLPGGYTVGQSLGSGRGHQGLDLLIATGTPIYAVADGVVATAGYSGAYGNLVVLNANVDGSAVEVRNGHMSSIAVSPGQSVTAGQVIGYVGSTGRSTAPHLHIEVRVNGGLVDPLYWLPM